jgi:hypothetical protein
MAALAAAPFALWSVAEIRIRRHRCRQILCSLRQPDRYAQQIVRYLGSLS